MKARPGQVAPSADGAIFFVSLAMFLVGMQMAETGAALDRITRVLGLSPTQEGILVSARFIGGVVTGLILWTASIRVRVRPVLVAALTGIAGSGLLLLSPTYVSALLIALIRGAALGAVIPLSGMFAAMQKSRPAGTVTATVNAAVSAGLVSLSGVALLLANVPDIPWHMYWLPASLGSIVALAILPFIRFPARSPAETRPRPSGALRRLAAVTTWPLAAAGFVVVGAEAIQLGLIPAQTARMEATAWTAEVYALLLMSGVLVGRFAATLWFRVASAGRVFLASVLAVVIFGVLWGLVPSLAPVLVVLLGIASAGLFPGLVAFIAEADPDRAGPTIAAAGWAGGAGGTVLPALVGLAFQVGITGRLTGLFVALPAVAAFAIVAAGARRRKMIRGRAD